MNGIHDMGGMHGMGPVVRERNEPTFHEVWEGRVYAITRVVRAAGGRQNIDNSRHLIELQPAADYLRRAYYERWFERLVTVLLANNTITREELESGKPAAGSTKSTPAVTASAVPAMVARRAGARRDAAVTPRFTVGERVRTRKINPTGHTRLPRYARGRVGVISRDHGVFVFPDTNSRFEGENPQHVYSVRFDARELWGEQAPPRDSVYIDLWDDYLDPA